VVMTRAHDADCSQTPTFNAVPVVEAALSAVRRGILVEIYMDLGFNDEVRQTSSTKLISRANCYPGKGVLTLWSQRSCTPGCLSMSEAT
jgi:hypothetical protein